MMNNLANDISITEESNNKHSITFRVKNAPHLHEKLSSLIQPSHVHVKGETRYKTKVWNNDMWLLKSPLSDFDSYTDHLLWIWKQLAPHKKYFKELISTGIELDIFCSFTSDCDQDGFILDRKFIETLSELSLPIEFSVIVL